MDPKDPAMVQRSMETFYRVGDGALRTPEAEKALIGFFSIWTFEKNFADFSAEQLSKALVHDLYHKKISIVDFVDQGLKGELTSRTLNVTADDFAKYYFKWKYIEDFKSTAGEEAKADWETYAKIKVKIEERYTYWVKNPRKAFEERLKETDDSARLGQLGVAKDHIFTIPPHPNTTFDEENFLILLEGSISLTLEEKQRVIDAIPRLGIDQINELINIFTEEKDKFSELEKEFGDEVGKLKKEREKEIHHAESKKEEEDESAADQEEVEKLKQNL